jgi:hypothetical protein
MIFFPSSSSGSAQQPLGEESLYSDSNPTACSRTQEMCAIRTSSSTSP